jgi:hypothetical protein
LKKAPFENVPRETFTNGFGLDDIVSRGTSLVVETSKSLKKRKNSTFPSGYLLGKGILFGRK